MNNFVKNFPNIPSKSVKLIENDGTITDEWYKVFDSFVQFIQKNISSEGVVIPELNNNDINKIANKTPTKRFIVDNTENKLKFFIDGEFKTIKFE